MAIVDSIILGRAKGSIGNVTLTTQKGRVIAKQKASIVSNPNTVAQQAQRGKLGKAVLAWQAIGIVIKSGWTSLLPFSSAYNTYVSKNLVIFAQAEFPGGTVVGSSLIGSFGSMGSLGSITYKLDEVVDDQVSFMLDPQTFKSIAKVGDVLKLVFGGLNNSEFSYSEVKVSQEMLDGQNGYVAFQGINTDVIGNPFSCIWLETADGKNSTTSKFKLV